jgi:hypothetical protein
MGEEQKEKENVNEYDVDVRLSGYTTIRVKAKNAKNAIECAERPLEPGDGIRLYCEVVCLKKVK